VAAFDSIHNTSTEFDMNKTSLIRTAVLGWYDQNRRALSWRVPLGRQPDPYAVWLSEVMLQQTTVVAVEGYFKAFIRKWPSVQALSAASDNDVMVAWAGLGYYARARNLLKCARQVVRDYNSKFPSSEGELQLLAGIGPYTAAAIAAIAFDRPCVPVDVNIERVVARLFAVRDQLPAAKQRIVKLAGSLNGLVRPGDFAQGLMDLGAMVCTSRSPACSQCPLRAFCGAAVQNIAEILPLKTPKQARPVRSGAAFWIERSDGTILLRRRPNEGLLGGMTEIPFSEWEEGQFDNMRVVASAPVHGTWHKHGHVTHTFTHFRLELDVFSLEQDGEPVLRASADPWRCFWRSRTSLKDEALPSLMRKIIAVMDGKS